MKFGRKQDKPENWIHSLPRVSSGVQRRLPAHASTAPRTTMTSARHAACSAWDGGLELKERAVKAQSSRTEATHRGVRLLVSYLGWLWQASNQAALGLPVRSSHRSVRQGFHAWIGLLLLSGLCDRAQRMLCLMWMIARVRCATRRSRRHVRRPPRHAR